MKKIEIAVRQPFTVIVAGEEYYIEYPVESVVELEAALGRSMKYASDWFRLETKELSAVLRYGFQKHHPTLAEELAARVCDGLNPEGIEAAIEGLCAYSFPIATARLQEALDKARNGQVPNGPSADAN